jgi:hypothetical protein
VKESLSETCIDKVDLQLTKPDGSMDENTEYTAPYSLYGNNGDNLFGRSLSPGQYHFFAWANDEMTLTGAGANYDFELLDPNLAEITLIIATLEQEDATALSQCRRCGETLRMS